MAISSTFEQGRGRIDDLHSLLVELGSIGSASLRSSVVAAAIRRPTGLAVPELKVV